MIIFITLKSLRVNRSFLANVLRLFCTGCGQMTECYKKSKLDSLSDIKFFTVVVKRLLYNDAGQMTINQNEIEVASKLSIEATNGQLFKFQPIAVIHHSGQVIDNDTRGHYMADVFDVRSNQWIRTSDDDPPKSVSHPCDNGYIYLYKRIN